ncbi:unnamed protein product [Didymodactylos carnosus]|uniref:BZIP domain-containing protein n=1 Tax=Didymodactylos carnosus TaxID=1234261 RepID=A0A8S2D2H6_9BILA|nr:unnamed protein product [Didymodactylos carnosus]CAF3570166.1 unnamed protein product [Didymodactylos carnosus]
MKILPNGVHLINDSVKSVPEKFNAPFDQQRLQLLADAVEKVEYEDRNQQHSPPSSLSSTASNDENYPQTPKSIESFTDFSSISLLQPVQRDILLKYITDILQQKHKQQQQIDLQSLIQKFCTNFTPPTDEYPIDFSKTKQNESHYSAELTTDESLSPLSSVNSVDSSTKTNVSSTYPFMVTNKNGKSTRPFKAYPKDPLSLPIGFYSPLIQLGNNITSENLLNVLPSSIDDFSQQFRKRIQHAQERITQRLTVTPDSPTKQKELNLISNLVTTSSTMQIVQPPKKRYRSQTSQEPLQEQIQSTRINLDSYSDMSKDDTYRERRRKNNEAAKRSRDARRAKEDEIAIRAAWLEQENLKLRVENVQLKEENSQLRYQIYNTTNNNSNS